MTAERCAEIIVEAAAEGRREEVMTPLYVDSIYSINNMQRKSWCLHECVCTFSCGLVSNEEG